MSLTADELIPTRATLLKRLKDWEDQSSWQEFFDTYWRLIYGVAVKGGLTREEAQDVVQETLVSVAKQMPTFQYDPSIGSFKGWLLNMTRWRITDHLRKRKHSASAAPETNPVDVEDEDKSEESLAPDLEKLWDVEWENNLLNAAIAKAKRRLDPELYQIFDLQVHKSMAPEAIAKLYNVPVAQIYLAKHRVTEAIRMEVERIRKEMI